MKKNTRVINIGLIGFGFIGKLHAKAYQSIPYCFPDSEVCADIKAVLRTKTSEDSQFTKALHIKKVTSDPDVFFSQSLDLVDICTPNMLHLDQVQEALKHVKNIYCEKPLGRSLSEARSMFESSQKPDVRTHTAFTTRYIPAFRQMKAIIENGGIGEPYHFHAHWFHSSYLDPKRPMSWRLRKADSGGGALADLGIHLFDQIRFMMGEMDWVQCNTRTFITRRPVYAGSENFEIVDVDDWALCTMGMKCGATGSVEVTRVSGGSSESNEFEIIGSQGTVKVNLDNPLSAQYFNARRNQWLVGVQDFPPPVGIRPIEKLWPPSKQSLGFGLNDHMASELDFLLNIEEKKESSLNFATALAAQEILEAAYISASKHGARISLPLDN